jgi:hypothetical protein
MQTVTSVSICPTPVRILFRAIHQGVTYHRMARPGTTSAELQVFDASRNIEGVGVTADVMRFQAQGSELQGIRLFAVNNASHPPRTQVHGKDFEFFLPDGAQVDQGMAMTAGGHVRCNSGHAWMNAEIMGGVPSLLHRN